MIKTGDHRVQSRDALPRRAACGRVRDWAGGQRVFPSHEQCVEERLKVAKVMVKGALGASECPAEPVDRERGETFVAQKGESRIAPGRWSATRAHATCHSPARRSSRAPRNPNGSGVMPRVASHTSTTSGEKCRRRKSGDSGPSGQNAYQLGMKR